MFHIRHYSGVLLPVCARLDTLVAPSGDEVSMVRKIETCLIDDLDQSRADETVVFALDNTSYEIDLNKTHSKQLRDALKPYIENGQRVSGRRKAQPSKTASDFDPRAVRS